MLFSRDYKTFNPTAQEKGRTPQVRLSRGNAGFASSLHTPISWSQSLCAEDTSLVLGAKMNTFRGSINGHTIIPGTHTSAGGTTNFNFNYPVDALSEPVHPAANIRADDATRKREFSSTVPFAPDPDFVDRPEILTWIRDKCAGPGARAALVGLGGIGDVNIRFLRQNANSQVGSRK